MAAPYPNQGVVFPCWAATWEPAVVRDKDEIMPAVAAWDRKATAEGFRCIVCSTTTAYIDREELFRTKMYRCAS